MPGSAGHDAWGHRNTAVPEHADIVAIGDSMTYGANVPVAEAWPQRLEKMTGRSTYNLSTPGYGPVEYLHLLESQAPSLRPDVVVIAIYMGNDLHDAWASAWRNERASDLRTPGARFEREPADAVELPRESGWPKLLRSRLQEHSFLYRATDLALKSLTRRHVTGNFYALRGDEYLEVGLSDPPRRTVLTPRRRSQCLDLSLPEIREGLAVTRRVLERAAELARENGFQPVIALVPTKEAVWDAAFGARDETWQRAARNEARARTLLLEQASTLGVEAVDLLPPVAATARENAVYPRHHDGHPLVAGHRAIARAIASTLSPGPLAVEVFHTQTN